MPPPLAYSDGDHREVHDHVSRLEGYGERPREVVERPYYPDHGAALQRVQRSRGARLAPWATQQGRVLGPDEVQRFVSEAREAESEAALRGDRMPTALPREARGARAARPRVDNGAREARPLERARREPDPDAALRGDRMPTALPRVADAHYREAHGALPPPSTTTRIVPSEQPAQNAGLVAPARVVSSNAHAHPVEARHAAPRAAQAPAANQPHLLGVTLHSSSLGFMIGMTRGAVDVARAVSPLQGDANVGARKFNRVVLSLPLEEGPHLQADIRTATRAVRAHLLLDPIHLNPMDKLVDQTNVVRGQALALFVQNVRSDDELDADGQPRRLNPEYIRNLTTFIQYYWKKEELKLPMARRQELGLNRNWSVATAIEFRHAREIRAQLTRDWLNYMRGPNPGNDYGSRPLQPIAGHVPMSWVLAAANFARDKIREIESHGFEVDVDYGLTDERGQPIFGANLTPYSAYLHLCQFLFHLLLAYNSASRKTNSNGYAVEDLIPVRDETTGLEFVHVLREGMHKSLIQIGAQRQETPPLLIFDGGINEGICELFNKLSGGRDPAWPTEMRAGETSPPPARMLFLHIRTNLSAEDDILYLPKVLTTYMLEKPYKAMQRKFIARGVGDPTQTVTIRSLRTTLPEVAANAGVPEILQSMVLGHLHNVRGARGDRRLGHYQRAYVTSTASLVQLALLAADTGRRNWPSYESQAVTDAVMRTKPARVVFVRSDENAEFIARNEAAAGDDTSKAFSLEIPGMDHVLGLSSRNDASDDLRDSLRTAAPRGASEPLRDSLQTASRRASDAVPVKKLPLTRLPTGRNFCEGCGERLSKGASFCGFCGQAAPPSASASAPATTSEDTWLSPRAARAATPFPGIDEQGDAVPRAAVPSSCAPAPSASPSIKDMKAVIVKAGLSVADLVEKSDVVQRYKEALSHPPKTPCVNGASSERSSERPAPTLEPDVLRKIQMNERDAKVIKGAKQRGANPSPADREERDVIHAYSLGGNNCAFFAHTVNFLHIDIVRSLCLAVGPEVRNDVCRAYRYAALEYGDHEGVALGFQHGVVRLRVSLADHDGGETAQFEVVGAHCDPAEIYCVTADALRDTPLYELQMKMTSRVADVPCSCSVCGKNQPMNNDTDDAYDVAVHVASAQKVVAASMNAIGAGQSARTALLKAFASSNAKHSTSCAICGAREAVRWDRVVVRESEVQILHAEWGDVDERPPDPHEIMNVLRAMNEYPITVREMYGTRSGDTSTAELTGFVAYSNNHFVGFTKEASGDWRLFDDLRGRAFHEMGQFASMASYCVRDRLAPTLFYFKVTAPKEPVAEVAKVAKKLSEPKSPARDAAPPAAAHAAARAGGAAKSVSRRRGASAPPAASPAPALDPSYARYATDRALDDAVQSISYEVEAATKKKERLEYDEYYRDQIGRKLADRKAKELADRIADLKNRLVRIKRVEAGRRQTGDGDRRQTERYDDWWED